YREFCEKFAKTGHSREKDADKNWLNRFFKGDQRVKMDLFLRYGVIAAAGDRHLAEFCPGAWYLKDPETVASWGFSLTPVSWRKDRTKELMAQSERMVAGEQEFTISPTGEKGVAQMKALLGLEDLVTNVNLPNRGQIPNLPLGAVVETNAVFTSDSVTPVFAGPIPEGLAGLIARTVDNQQLTVKAVVEKDLGYAFDAFINDVSNHLDLKDSRKLFDEMIANTKEYLTMYEL
ncbi:MAG: alpha-glucosidase/alpha-galactosidase, partial [Clostridia bacterium]